MGKWELNTLFTAGFLNTRSWYLKTVNVEEFCKKSHLKIQCRNVSTVYVPNYKEIDWWLVFTKLAPVPNQSGSFFWPRCKLVLRRNWYIGAKALAVEIYIKKQYKASTSTKINFSVQNNPPQLLWASTSGINLFLAHPKRMLINAKLFRFCITIQKNISFFPSPYVKCNI